MNNKRVSELIFIKDNEQTILRIASKATGRYITRSDDGITLFQMKNIGKEKENKEDRTYDI